jgi:hypothetical protein
MDKEPTYTWTDVYCANANDRIYQQQLAERYQALLRQAHERLIDAERIAANSGDPLDVEFAAQKRAELERLQ